LLLFDIFIRPGPEEWETVFTRVLLACHVLLLLSACSSSPVQVSDETAASLGFERAIVKGGGFNHVVYTNRIPVSMGLIHVYLEGDGSPWRHEREVSIDPGPRNPLMLRLMALDATASIYLGRPCYHGLAGQPPCHPYLWTHGRYSSRIVDAMAQALEQVARDNGADRLVLIGYSGGGAIAMLLAERVPDVVAVVTLAGNLDPEAWAEHRNYSLLQGSLNPANRAPLPSRIVQLHIAGENDDVVPPNMIKSAIQYQDNAQFRIIPDIDHACCWQSVWPSILENLETRVAR